MSIDDFKHWKVDLLRKYCQNRGFGVTNKRKEELVALTYTMYTQNVQRHETPDWPILLQISSLCVPRSREEKLSWMFFFQVVHGHPGGCLQFSRGGSKMAWVLTHSLSYLICVLIRSCKMPKDSETMGLNNGKCVTEKSLTLYILCTVLINTTIGIKSVLIQLAQCRFPGMAIAYAKILIYFHIKYTAVGS